MGTKQIFNIPDKNHLNGGRIKIIESLEVGSCHNMGQYSADLMRCISKSISYFKLKTINGKKVHSKKVFIQRQDKDSSGQLIINLYRIK